MNHKAVFLKFDFLFLSLAVFFCACRESAPQENRQQHDARHAAKYAKRFGIAAFDTYTLVSVFGNRENFDTTANFILSASDDEVTTSHQVARHLQVPCKRIASLSCIYSSMLAELGAAEAIVAIDNFDYVNDSTITKRYRAGQIIELSKGPQPDLEKTLALSPDLLLMFGMGNVQRDVPKGFSESGLPLVMVIDHLEEHPLARAEWVKFFAAFCNKLSLADSLFSEVERNYQTLQLAAKSYTQHPSVFSEIKYGEAWYMPGGKSFMSLLITDAGGNYLWHDIEQSGSLPLSFEQVLIKAGEADIWLNQPMMFSLQDILNADPRYAAFKAFKSGKVYNNCLHRNKKGYSPYWETGMMHPERILADLVKIFHSDTVVTAAFNYYEQLK